MKRRRRRAITVLQGGRGRLWNAAGERYRAVLRRRMMLGQTGRRREGCCGSYSRRGSDCGGLRALELRPEGIPAHVARSATKNSSSKTEYRPREQQSKETKNTPHLPDGCSSNTTIWQFSRLLSRWNSSTVHLKYLHCRSSES
jgi:hypothetical protein